MLVEKTDNMPIWVFLAYSAINTRKAALILIGACAIFTVYCIPWSSLFANPQWLGKLFRIEDWSWVLMMVPIMLWYWISLRWLDNNSGWAQDDSTDG